MKTLPAFLCAAFLLLLPAAAQAQPVETELAGVTAEVVELRQSRRRPAPGRPLRQRRCEDRRSSITMRSDRIVLVDVKSKKKHFPLKDANGQFIGGPIGDWLDGGRIALKVPQQQSTVLWAYFEPVAPGTVMNVEVPYVFPFENVPVTEGAGKVFASGTAGTHPRPGCGRPSSRRDEQTRS